MTNHRADFSKFWKKDIFGKATLFLNRTTHFSKGEVGCHFFALSLITLMIISLNHESYDSAIGKIEQKQIKKKKAKISVHHLVMENLKSEKVE